MNWRVPLADVQLGPEEAAAVLSVLQSGWLTMGAVTQNFEQDFATFCGAQYALAMTNATAALHLACLSVGVGVGDEVIVPSLSFVASANAIAYTGAAPVFADIEGENWLTISPKAIEEALTPKTKAIMVMHYAGYACDMPQVMAIAKKHHLAVIEDAAHAVGASLQGKALGTWGDVGCYSFFGNKNMTTAEGGMLVTDDAQIAQKARLLRSHGMTTLTWDRHHGHASTYDVVALGYNYRIDEIRSAIGREQLKKIPAGNRRRGELARLYRDLLAELVPQVDIPFRAPRGESSYHIMPVLLPKGADKARFMANMKEHGIQTSWHYPPAHTFSIYTNSSDRHSASLALTNLVAQREVTLPLFPSMTDDQVSMVVEASRASLFD